MSSKPAHVARVSIVVRTRDRPVLLERALRSIGAQTFADWQVVLVDQGNFACTETVVAGLGPEIAGKVLHIPAPPELVSGGLLNLGVRSGDSQLVTVLDDDDTWHPQFLEAMVGALDARPTPLFAGAACHTEWVDEEPDGAGGWREISVRPKPGFHDLTIHDLFRDTQFTIHAFLYERSAYEAVGGYEDEAVAFEDWGFHQRFMQRYDILPVHQRLARYHLRPSVTQGELANSVARSRLAHLTARSSVVNAAMREQLEGTGHGEGLFRALARAEHNLHQKLHFAEQRQAQVEEVLKRLESLSERIGKIDSRTRELKESVKRLEKQSGPAKSKPSFWKRLRSGFTGG